MALSRITYTATGSNQVFAVPFPFINESNVDCLVNGTSSTFSFDNSSTITISSPTVVANDSVQVIRRTNITSIIVDYFDGSGLPAADLDTTSLQLFYLAQEAFDDSSGATTSAQEAAASAAAAAADAVLTAADVVATNADVVLTNADVVSTNADVVSTGNDVTSTNADVVSTNADVLSAAASADAVAYQYTFSTTTAMADPGAGVFRANSATPASITAIAIDDTTNKSGNPDISPFIITWDDSTSTIKGHVTFFQEDDPTIFMVFTITGLTDNSGWTQLAVTHITGSTLWGNTKKCRIHFTRAGDGVIPATTSAAGVVELLTDAEAITGSDTTRAMTAAAGLALFATAHPIGATAADTIKGSSLETEGHIVFPSTQVGSATANHLDDYEEGTFTPTITDGTNVATPSTAAGYYVKIGRIVICSGHINSTSLNSVSGDIRLGGLPFTSINNNYYGTLNSGDSNGLAITATADISGHVANNSTHILMQLSDATTGHTAMQGSEWSDNGDMKYSFTYTAAA